MNLLPLSFGVSSFFDFPTSGSSTLTALAIRVLSFESLARSETDKPLSLYNRVKQDMIKHPILWTLISYQITTIFSCIVVRTIRSTLYHLILLGFLFYTRYLVEENENLGSMRKQIDVMGTQLEMAQKQKDDVQKEISQLQSATKNLIDNISKIDSSTTVLNSTVEKGESGLSSLIEKLSSKITTFTNYISRHQNTWDAFQVELERHQKAISKAQTDFQTITKRYYETHTQLCIAQTKYESQNNLLEETNLHLKATKEDLRSEVRKLKQITTLLIQIYAQISAQSGARESWTRQEACSFFEKLIEALPPVSENGITYPQTQTLAITGGFDE